MGSRGPQVPSAPQVPTVSRVLQVPSVPSVPSVPQVPTLMRLPAVSEVPAGPQVQSAGRGQGAHVQREVEGGAHAQWGMEGAAHVQREVEGVGLAGAEVVMPQGFASRSSAAALPVVSRSVQVGREHTLDGHGQQDVPLVGYSEPIGRSPFVAALGGLEAGPAVQRMVEAGPVVGRVVEHQVAGRPVEVQRAGLLWPPPVGVQRQSAPLSGAVELVQRATSEESEPTPAVQRVVHGHPALGAPVMPQPAREASPAGAVQARAEGEALSWTLEDSFQPAEAVRSVPLQRMFSEEVVQTAEETPAAAAAPPAAAAAPGEAKKATVSAAEIEELAKRLYEPLTAKLKAELWLDRERAGRVSDRW
ncbi:hypothetical protein GCM10027269_68710 [Kribbella endophytica]